MHYVYQFLRSMEQCFSLSVTDFWGYPHKLGLNYVVVAKSLFPSFTQIFGGHHIVSGFQSPLIEIHRLALFAFSCIIGSIHSWNSIALRTLLIVLQGMLIFWVVRLG